MNNFRVYILFNVKKPELGNNTDPVWISKRMDLFEKYTLQSLRQQTDQDFEIDLLCCPESRDLFQLRHYKIPGVTLHFSIQEYFDYINDCVCWSPAAGCKEPYLLKIDSDDLYHKRAIEICRSRLQATSGIEHLAFVNGYVYDLDTGAINHFSNGVPFYCTHFVGGSFTYDNLMARCFCDQTRVRKEFNPLVIAEKMFCVLDHDTCLHKDPKRMGTELNHRSGFGAEVQDIDLANFGIDR